MKAGVELDEMVAEKVMGWTLFKTGILDKRPPRKPVYRWGEADEGEARVVIFVDRGDGSGWWEWSPSTDIADAWEVVDKMTYPDGVRALEGGMLLSYGSQQGCWFVSFGLGKTNIADTAPHAICLAALEAMGK